MLEGELSQLALCSYCLLFCPLDLLSLSHLHLHLNLYHSQLLLQDPTFGGLSLGCVFLLYLLHLSPCLLSVHFFRTWPTLSFSSSLPSPPVIPLKAGFHSSLCDATGKEIGIFHLGGLCHILPV